MDFGKQTGPYLGRVQERDDWPVPGSFAFWFGIETHLRLLQYKDSAAAESFIENQWWLLPEMPGGHLQSTSAKRR
jgi:hypothetical protein